jgi:hypothetical protein
MCAIVLRAAEANGIADTMSVDIECDEASARVALEDALLEELMHVHGDALGGSVAALAIESSISLWLLAADDDCQQADVVERDCGDVEAEDAFRYAAFDGEEEDARCDVEAWHCAAAGAVFSEVTARVMALTALEHGEARCDLMAAEAERRRMLHNDELTSMHLRRMRRENVRYKEHVAAYIAAVCGDLHEGQHELAAALEGGPRDDIARAGERELAVLAVHHEWAVAAITTYDGAQASMRSAVATQETDERSVAVEQSHVGWAFDVEAVAKMVAGGAAAHPELLLREVRERRTRDRHNRAMAAAWLTFAAENDELDTRCDIQAIAELEFDAVWRDFRNLMTTETVARRDVEAARWRDVVEHMQGAAFEASVRGAVVEAYFAALVDMAKREERSHRFVLQTAHRDTVFRAKEYGLRDTRATRVRAAVAAQKELKPAVLATRAPFNEEPGSMFTVMTSPPRHTAPFGNAASPMSASAPSAGGSSSPKHVMPLTYGEQKMQKLQEDIRQSWKTNAAPKHVARRALPPMDPAATRRKQSSQRELLSPMRLPQPM